MSVGSLDWLLQHSHNYPLLTAEQEIIYNRHVREWLALRDKTNPNRREQAIIRRGKRAYDRFFMSNIRMVVHLAQRYRRFVGALTLEDMTQEGLIGLERAIVKFDATRGYKFSTYAFNWIRQSINRSISSKSRMIRLPDNATQSIKKALDYMNEYRREHGRRPTLQQTAEHCNISIHSLRTYLPHGAPVISLDELCSNAREDSSTLLELIADENNTNEVDVYAEQVDRLYDALGTLNPIDRHILDGLYYGINGVPVSMRQLASDAGISRQAVAQRHNNTLRRLRLKLAQRELPDTPALQCAA